MADSQPSQDQVEELYQPKDAITAAIKATGVTGAAGAFVSTIQNTLVRHNAGAWGAITRFGGTTALFGKDKRGYKCGRGGREESADSMNTSCDGRSLRIHQECLRQPERKGRCV